MSSKNIKKRTKFGRLKFGRPILGSYKTNLNNMYPKSSKKIIIQSKTNEPIFYLIVSSLLLILNSFYNSNNYYQTTKLIINAEAVSIKPTDFDRLIMPCYGESSYSSGNPISGASSYQAMSAPSYRESYQGNSYPTNRLPPSSSSGQGSIPGQQNDYRQSGSSYLGDSSSSSSVSYGGGTGSSLGSTNLAATLVGQSLRPVDTTYNSYGYKQFPRANSIENFIALVTKIEAAIPRLAASPDQLIRMLLERFRMDNYYYDVRNRVHVGDQDHRIRDILPALFSSQSRMNNYDLGSSFPENILDQNEKCSLYFMLSHFVDKTSSAHQPLGGIPVSQMNPPSARAMPLQPPSLQAAGSGYPSRSANMAYGGASGPSYPGPANGFGSPATQNMASFGSGINSNPESSGNNPYGMNSVQPNPLPFLNRERNTMTGTYPADPSGSSRLSGRVVLDGLSRFREDMTAVEYGVVTVSNQDNAALALNRVLLGLLAAETPPQSIEQLSRIIYPTQSITQTPKMGEEIDPLFAVTLADLWAVSSIPKSGKRFDMGRLEVAGRWNDTMCPLIFTLERAESIRFTKAELAGGLDGFNLGKVRREMLQRGKNLRLSQMLRMYYSKDGFRPQFGAEYSVCNRGSGITTSMDNLMRQAENYLRLYQMNLPVSDIEISRSIAMVGAFRDSIKRVTDQPPTELCLMTDLGEIPGSDQCEIGKSDAVTLLDVSPESNELFMKLVVKRLASKLGLSRTGNRFTILTNQNMGGPDFNTVLRNSTNIAEVGCALTYDTSIRQGGGEVTDPTRMIEMFEHTFISLDTEYLIRRDYAQASSGSQRSSWNSYYSPGGFSYSEGGEDTGGSKVMIWFNYGRSPRIAPSVNSPTNWLQTNYESNNQYKFQEAKDLLRENFRGASILVVTNDRDSAKPYVYDEERDIFTDIPTGTGISTDISYPYMTDLSAAASMSGQVESLVSKLLNRMCDIPSLFQYARCTQPSNGNTARGLISPGKRQYWMMAPKTFYASQSVKMVFRVEGGRLRVCFGRMQHPEESANKYSRESGTAMTPLITISNQQSPTQQANQITSGSYTSNNYYTGLEYGVCKDVGSGQQIDFIVDTPCYKKSIAECQPFYFDIKEMSYGGEGDINYLCRDEGCKRLDQVKFTMTHTGVQCNSGFKSINISYISALLMTLITTALISSECECLRSIPIGFVSIILTGCLITHSKAQQAGVYDFGQARHGEKRDDYTPSQTFGMVLILMAVVAGLALACGLCYYVSKRRSNRMEQVPREPY